MNLEVFSFFILSFFVAITPGPSVIYVVSYSLRYGTKAGIASTLGINLGSVVAILLAAFGLSSLLEIYPNAIIIIQLAGGLYVVYLAILMWPRGLRANTGEQSPGAQSLDTRSSDRQSYGKLFRNGFITSVLNPKDILFYTAFIPAFIPQTTAMESYQTYFLLLAFAYMLIGFVTKSAFAIFCGQARRALESNKIYIVNCISSLLLFCVGVFLLVNAMTPGSFR